MAVGGQTNRGTLWQQSETQSWGKTEGKKTECSPAAHTNTDGPTGRLTRTRPDVRAHTLCGSTCYGVREQTELTQGDRSQRHGYLGWGADWPGEGKETLWGVASNPS